MGRTGWWHGWRALALITLVWTVAVAGVCWWVLQDRLRGYREQAHATAGVRLNGVKDVLGITFRQLAALPLDLAHRPAVAALLADESPPTSSRVPEVQRIMARMGTDFGLPLVALIDRNGALATSNSAITLPAPVRATDFSTRDYFVQAMAHGAAMQFLLGRASRVPGLYFASRVEQDGASVGVTVVKQETEALNRLLTDADGSLIFMTDANNVLVLGNQPDLLMQRLPGGPAREPAVWDAVYQGVPATLPWTSARQFEGGRAMTLTTVAGMPHVTLSATLGDTPFKLWVLVPLDDEPAIARGAWTVALAVWAVGCLLIWLSWRRLHLMDAALRARREIFELTQALPLTVFRYQQPAKGSPRFAFLGRGVEELFGVNAETIEKDPELPWRLADGGDRPPTRPREFMVKRGDESAWLLADSAPQLDEAGGTVYNGYWLDITSRREAQARFAAVFEHASTGYLFFDAKRGITHCNPATLRLFGAETEQRLIGRIPWFPGLSPELQPDGVASRLKALDGMRRHTLSGDRVHAFEWRFRRFDDTLFDADVSVIALEWLGTPRFCAVIQDITLRKQTEAAMQHAREAAEAASQTKSSFLANMSHELRTPMNAIIGMTHLALEDGLPDKQRDYIEKANGSARSLLQILNDILDVSKIEAGQMDLERIDFELESVVGDMADVLGMRADEKGLELLFSAAPDLPKRLVGDPTRLRQVLVNLGGNAIKFTDRGEVTVGMEVSSNDDDGVELHAWVRDTGVGLSPEDLERVFQPFVQGDSSTTRRFGGTGLGLVISRQLVERMGGRLWVDSVPGSGSTFHFTARFGRSTPRAPARAWMANELRGRRALLVDDNVAALDVLTQMLQSLGVVVDRATSGAEGLELFERNADRYTWCLLDWKMPEMDGVECARRIWRKHAALRPCVLLVTAFARDDALRASVGVPLAGVLHKPVTPSSLHDSLVQARRAEGAAPLAARRAALAPKIEEAVRQRLKGARILLVEDHPLNQQLACELLRRAGMVVVVAGDGGDALRQLEDNGPFDGVLMDCQMPIMDGYTATRALRSDPRWASLPVIAMTASALVEDRDRALASGMNAHITKPIHVDLMLRTMSEWISGPDSSDGGPATAPGALTVPGALEDGSPPPPLGAINAEDGLAYCMGNHDLYLKLLRGFKEAMADFADEMHAALSAGAPDQAMRRSHDLKGLAGTIGAHRLRALAVTVNRTLRGGEPVDDTLPDLLDELEVVIREIDSLLPVEPAVR